MPDLSAHDWFRPRLTALIAQAAQAGIARDVAVAVITDLVGGPLFNDVPPETDEDWNKDIGEPDAFVNHNEPISAEPTSTVSDLNILDGAGHLPGHPRL